MPRISVKDFRRNELIEAAIVAIAERGLPDTTLATIAAQAGVSPALVNHYFDGKEDLLEATLRRLAKDLAQTILRLLPKDPTPQDRLRAIIDGCMTAEHLAPGAMFVWLSFWGHIPTNPKFAAFQRTINRRYRSNMRFALKQLLPEHEVEEACLGLLAIIDGFWIRQVIDPSSFDFAVARDICRNYLKHLIELATQ
jgi:TetR/AcrR family transcriptional repressor of bet genes